MPLHSNTIFVECLCSYRPIANRPGKIVPLHSPYWRCHPPTPAGTSSRHRARNKSHRPPSLRIYLSLTISPCFVKKFAKQSIRSWQVYGTTMPSSSPRLMSSTNTKSCHSGQSRLRRRLVSNVSSSAGDAQRVRANCVREGKSTQTKPQWSMSIRRRFGITDVFAIETRTACLCRFFERPRLPSPPVCSLVCRQM